MYFQAKSAMRINVRIRKVGLVLLAALVLPGSGYAEEHPLPALNLDLSQTTVSGISSGAFMAVQFAVAHSATVRGVAATAGGPYFCAGQDAWAGAGVGKAIARCMQGDPAYPAQPISDGDLAQMAAAARSWAGKGLIDSVDNLQNQRVWLFHGYNDGIVKKPVGDALFRWYGAFVPAGGVFYKDGLKAGHAQISASCGGDGAECQPCAVTGGDFINACADDRTPAQAYDAAGAALQFFYGPLQRTASASLSGAPQRFDQRPYIRRNGKAIDPLKASMADSGYLYVPAACAAGQPCRLHVAFHGCQQQAGENGSPFARRAGYNEWADANRIVVLYPQTAATGAAPLTPFNPQGCWDWWGYNDFSFDLAGHYATRDGAQISAVWRMLEQLAKGAGGTLPAPAAAGAAPSLAVIDASAKQLVLAWSAIRGAAAYRVERDGREVGRVNGGALSWVDNGLAASSAYSYTVRAIDASGNTGPAATAVTAQTGKAAPFCDPYFSLAQNRAVNRYNLPSNKTCP